jgi:hypothetical protein
MNVPLMGTSSVVLGGLWGAPEQHGIPGPDDAANHIGQNAYRVWRGGVDELRRQ